MENSTLKISGMTCMGCAASVERKLKEQAGVTQAQVDLEAGTAEVSFDAATVSLDALKNALRNAGWGVA